MKKVIAFISSVIVMLSVAIIPASASIGSTPIVDGTKRLFTDLTAALMILSPIVGTAMIIYFLIRKGSADEVDQKKWKTAISVTAICMIGVVAASAVINAVLGYYRG